MHVHQTRGKQEVSVLQVWGLLGGHWFLQRLAVLWSDLPREQYLSWVHLLSSVCVCMCVHAHTRMLTYKTTHLIRGRAMVNILTFLCWHHP